MNKEKLKAVGVHYDYGASFFGRHNPEVYEKYLADFFASQPIETIERHIANNDFPAAFRKAKEMQTIATNLQIHTFENEMLMVVNALRHGRRGVNYSFELNSLKNAYEKVVQAANEE